MLFRSRRAAALALHRRRAPARSARGRRVAQRVRVGNVGAAARVDTADLAAAMSVEGQLGTDRVFAAELMAAAVGVEA